MKLTRQKKIIVGALALILSLMVGYAIFSESLNIKGTASTITITYEQDSEGRETTTNPSERVYQVGDEFCLGEECFYVIKDNGDSVTALAKYNLLVGNTCTSSSSCTPIDTSTPGYGKQSPTARGWVEDYDNWIGTIAFSEDNYWVENDYELKPEYGSSYPANVYDENSLLYEPVENYESYLKNNLGKTSVEARLITYDELESLGCSGDSYSCESAPSWVYYTTYVGSTAISDMPFLVQTDSMIYRSFCNVDYVYGIRPVITINKSEI